MSAVNKKGAVIIGDIMVFSIIKFILNFENAQYMKIFTKKSYKISNNTLGTYIRVVESIEFYLTH